MKRLLVSLLLIALVACGSSGPVRGTVVSKYIDPESTYVTYISVGGGCSGNPPVCIPPTQIPILNTDDTDWVLVIHGVPDDSGDTPEWQMEVTPEFFERTQVGDSYDECDYKECD